MRIKQGVALPDERAVTKERNNDSKRGIYAWRYQTKIKKSTHIF